MRLKKLLCACALGTLTFAAAAQGSYPSKPIRMVVGFAPGGAADLVARAMSEAFGKALGQPIVVENKPGNGSSIAADIAAKSPADGYTILIASPSSISVNPALNPKLAASVRDLVPVTKITTSPLVLAVNPATGINTVPELIAAARKRPGELNYSTSGNGSAPHLGAALFTLVTKTEMTHVPYRGGSLAIQSVMAGDTQVTFGTSPSVLPMTTSGKLKALAVSTRERSALVPSLPGMREAGLPDYDIEFWYGIFLPAGTPEPIVRKVYDAAISAMRQPQVKATLARDGTEVSTSESPAAFRSFLAEDGKFWVNLVKNANVKVE
ncbi:Bug family tripartite tricarboxylate transporter substrate binding protein [Comamonas endophytica]|uniref:Tripartite tricarboxylate transporter substrate binding protein n=1 Tax=Comamonas endophytica TaxID=2949090 RepID=A0ABY6GCG3_9BURK|nr:MULTISPECIES: tripartite tricarboxylate transporter substrate binding protein [unclassified Acidovorax]MCD2513765.1 tripartite tricarboxylate transporter substrate binding protein [Acidovorax sp. D4N7]UYG52232.1 tripartite tricarboxylate transporter substrate binding protein [Acidovorax sp. 5MLIR]